MLKVIVLTYLFLKNILDRDLCNCFGVVCISFSGRVLGLEAEHDHYSL